MNIHKGTDRIVFVGERKAVKIPRVRGSLAFTAFNEMRQDMSLGTAWKCRNTGGRYSTQGHLTRGIEANKTEARLARLYPEIIHATRGLLGGLINIQDTVIPLNHDRLSIANAFKGQLGDQTLAIGHILDNAGNFGQNKEGNPRIIDAGSTQLGQLLGDEAMHKATQETLSGLRHE